MDLFGLTGNEDWRHAMTGSRLLALFHSHYYREGMIRTLEAVIDVHGVVHLLEEIQLPASRRALVTVLEDEPAANPPETALLSETALAADWNRPEEDAAWAHFQQKQ